MTYHIETDQLRTNKELKRHFDHQSCLFCIGFSQRGHHFKANKVVLDQDHGYQNSIFISGDNWSVLMWCVGHKYTQQKNVWISSNNSNKYLIQNIENKCVSKTECPLSGVHKINTQTVMHDCTGSINSSSVRKQKMQHNDSRHSILGIISFCNNTFIFLMPEKSFPIIITVTHACPIAMVITIWKDRVTFLAKRDFLIHIYFQCSVLNIHWIIRTSSCVWELFLLSVYDSTVLEKNWNLIISFHDIFNTESYLHFWKKMLVILSTVYRREIFILFTGNVYVFPGLEYKSITKCVHARTH